MVAWDRRRLAVAVAGGAMVGYGMLVAWPATGLPRQFEANTPPAFMRWLASVETPNDRSFGIMPDPSGFAGPQDISMAGPLAPPAFFELVRLIGDEQTIASY